MKIALVDNMNNNFFTLARYLRDLGYDAHLFYFNENEHFLPFNDTFDLEYQDFTHCVDWDDLYSENKRIVNDLKGFDVIFGCGKAPYLLEKAGLKINFLIPYGGDIYNIFLYKGNKKFEVAYHAFKALIKRHLAINIKHREEQYRNAIILLLQERGIKKVDKILYQIEKDNFGKFFETLGVKDKWEIGFSPVIYDKIYNPEEIKNYYDQSHWYKIFKKIRDENELVIFHHSRHIWKTIRNPFDIKGNDRLIRAFSRFVKENPSVKAKLILFEYGRDFVFSKSLVKEQGIEKYVQWFPKLPRKEIMIGISLCDLGATIFGVSGITCGVICEFLAMGKLFIGERDDDFYKPYYEDLYPLLNASSEEEIYNQIVYFYNNKEELVKLGKKCLDWNKKYMVDKPIKLITNYLEENG